MTNHPTTPTTIIIFGASGDLTRRKLIPGLFKNWQKGRLPENWQVVGFAWTDWDSDTFRAEMTSGIHEFVSADCDCTDFVNRIHYVQGSFTEPADFSKLKPL